MDASQFDPIAHLLMEAHDDSVQAGVRFLSEHGHPTTSAGKAHHFRAVAQGLVADNSDFELCTDFMQNGRLGYTDLRTGVIYVVKSNKGVRIEQNKAQGGLFDATLYIRSEVSMLVYNFHPEGLGLSVAATQQQQGRSHLEASGIPTYIGTWPYVGQTEPPPFDQGDIDDFNWDEDDEEEEEGGEG
jgi:hypothetical protein